MNSILSLFLLASTWLQTPPVASSNPARVGMDLDHVLVLVSDDRLMAAIEQLGFSVFGRVSQHQGQGTSGRYVFFYNGYLEFLSLDNAEEARANADRFGSDYAKRWTDLAHACPLGVGLRAKPFKPEAFPFPTHRYRPKLPGKKDHDHFYQMDLSNRVLTRPFVFVSQPGAEHPTIDHLTDLDVVSDLKTRAELKAAHSHRIGVKRITHVTFEVPSEVAETALVAFKTTQRLSVIRGNRCHVTLTFDKGIRGKVLTPLREYPLTLRY